MKNLLDKLLKGLTSFKEEMNKAEGEQLYHIHVSGQRITDKPMSIKDITKQHGPVKQIESDGKTRLVPHVGNIKKEEDCGHEMLKTHKNGQWSLVKDDSVKPFGQSVYNSAANINRKANRTGEERPDVGRNVAVHRYTTSGSSVNAAREARQAKEQASANKKAPVKTLKDMSSEEKARLESQYKTKIKE